MRKIHPGTVFTPNFIKLWLSQTLSQLTIQLVNFSVLTRVFEVTQSTVAASMLWVSYSLPALFFAPFSGAIVDRIRRRRMMIITNLLQAVTVAMYLWVPQNRVFLLYALVFAYSFLDQLYLPSQQASIPSVVDKPLLPTANGVFLLTQQASFLVGFGMGGGFLALLGRQNTTILASVFLFFAAIAVYLLPRDWAKHARVHVDLDVYFNDFKKGYRYIREHRGVMYPLLMIAVTQIFITVIAVVLPTYTHQVLGLNLNYASFTFVVPGALGAFILTRNLQTILQKRRKKELIETGFFVAGLALLALSQLYRAGSFKVPLAVLIAVSLGLAFASIMIPSQTLLQEKTPTWFRGRIYGSLSFLLIIGTSVPLILSAVVSDVFGVGFMIGSVAILLLLGLLFIKKKGDDVLANGFGL